MIITEKQFIQILTILGNIVSDKNSNLYSDEFIRNCKDLITELENIFNNQHKK